MRIIRIWGARPPPSPTTDPLYHARVCVVNTYFHVLTKKLGTILACLTFRAVSPLPHPRDYTGILRHCQYVFSTIYN